jgi:hypothetical protein
MEIQVAMEKPIAYRVSFMVPPRKVSGEGEQFGIMLRM